MTREELEEHARWLIRTEVQELRLFLGDDDTLDPVFLTRLYGNQDIEGSVSVFILRRMLEAFAARPRLRDEWHDDMGAVQWWRFPIDEPPYVGTPLDDDWPGYHTHWTPIVVPDAPEAA